MTKRFCDSCKQEIEQGKPFRELFAGLFRHIPPALPFTGMVTFPAYTRGDYAPEGSVVRVELCGECAHTMAERIAAACK